MEWKRGILMAVALLACVGLNPLSAAAERTDVPAGEEAEAKAESTGESRAQAICPVMGMPIDKSVFIDHDGQRVYFCCAPCTEQFKRDPDTFIKKLEDQGVVLEKAPQPQTVCPVLGRPIDKNVFIDHDGWRIYMCCPPCIEKFRSEPATYLKKLEDQGFTLERTPGDSTGHTGDHPGGK